MPRRPRRKKSSRPPPAARPTQLLYKVVELSTVDDQSLEDTVNQWVLRGWNLDGVQFAMRESSKRPAMAFVFFTRSAALETEPPIPEDVGEAKERLLRLATSADPLETVPGAEEEGELGGFRELDPGDLEGEDL